MHASVAAYGCGQWLAPRAPRERHEHKHSKQQTQLCNSQAFLQDDLMEKPSKRQSLLGMEDHSITSSVRRLTRDNSSLCSSSSLRCCLSN